MRLPGLDPIENEIILHVRNNPGLSKEEIVRHIKQKSRITVLNRIRDLESRNVIKLSRPNSQMCQIFINEENKLTSALVELEEFKESYFNLLSKSREKINAKDYSLEAKKLGFEEADPLKWGETEKIRFILVGLEKLRENMHASLEYRDWLKSSATNLQKSIDALEEMKTKIRARKVLSEDIVKLSLEEIVKLKPVLGKRISVVNAVKDYEAIFLTFHAIFLFYIFSEIMFFRTTLVWPNTIQDKPTLSRLYSTVYEKISEIQMHLLEFLKSVKMGLGLVYPSPKDMMSTIKRVFRKDPGVYIEHFIPRYEVLGMLQQINRVVRSLSILNEEISDIHNFRQTEIESINELQELMDWINSVTRNR